jgi:DNA repair protein RadA/Sms
VALPTDVVACGEVGLGGELRQVGHTARRLAEAARLGFRRAIVPASAPEPPPGLQVSRVGTLADAIVGLRLAESGPF